MMRRNTEDLILENLNDILEATVNAANFAHNLTQQEFLLDRKVKFAVIRCLEIISRKARWIRRYNRLRQYNRLPWREMIGLERKLNHAYQELNANILWRTIKEDLANLETQLRSVLGANVRKDIPKHSVRPGREKIVAEQALDPLVEDNHTRSSQATVTRQNSDEATIEKTVYIIGAGFSKAAGAPLQNEILRNIFAQNIEELDSAYRALYEENLAWLRRFLENEMYIAPTHFNDVALEDLYTPIDRCIIDNIAFRNTPPSELITARQKISSLIVMLIDHKLRFQRTNLVYADRLAEYLVNQKRTNTDVDSFSIISTNWDILIDNAIKLRTIENDQAIDYCFPVLPYGDETSLSNILDSAKRFKIKILKLHGSMNWLRCQWCQRIYVTFFEKIALDDYLRKPPCVFCQRNYSDESESEVRASLVSDLVMPTFLKVLNNVHLKLVWHTAAIELSEADKIVFMGYSFPLADFELRQLLSRSIKRSANIDVVLHASDAPPPHPSDGKSFPEFRYRSFFGKHAVRFYYNGVESYINGIAGHNNE